MGAGTCEVPGMATAKNPHAADKGGPAASRSGEAGSKARRSPVNGRLRKKESSESLLTGIARATRKPGISRTAVFRSGSRTRIYAYSVMPSDTSKIVREDARGAKTVGRLVKGRFVAFKTKTA